ncbi:DUF424 domain-containing protein [Candidatus Nitrosocosmicus franklandus]|uniref:DUF424 domain-containing protein n=1 Tax=Candidatus Nitrosocosmicus franklandianus TaxID=1798806 RepID=A0A484I7J6_9ARCH|nr:DUF424 family protein [Candidatus Nitrosocosmicus franklandus]VFJ13066.1 conserved protein of unknown function [Candidatus Nitrosocosmicus franklandus]
MNQNKIFALRKIKYQETTMINICDIELLDKEINKGDFIIQISKNYFLEEEIDEREAITMLKSSSVLNLVGNRIVKLALELRLAKENSIKVIDNIPFLMIFRFVGNY